MHCSDMLFAALNQRRRKTDFDKCASTMKRIYVLWFFSLNLPSLNKQPSIIFITSIDCISAKSFLSKLGVCVYQVQCMCV